MEETNIKKDILRAYRCNISKVLGYILALLLILVLVSIIV